MSSLVVRTSPLSGSVPVKRPSCTHTDSSRVGDVDADVVGETGERAPRRAAAEHHVERLVDAVGGQRGVERRDRARRSARRRAGGSAPRAPAAVGEADGLLGRPAPGRLGRVGRRRARRPARREYSSKAASSASYDAGRSGSVGVLVGRRRPGARRSCAQNHCTLGEVPEQVGGGPVGAAGHPGLGVAVGQHLAEPRGLGSDVSR